VRTGEWWHNRRRSWIVVICLARRRLHGGGYETRMTPAHRSGVWPQRRGDILDGLSRLNGRGTGRPGWRCWRRRSKKGRMYDPGWIDGRGGVGGGRLGGGGMLCLGVLLSSGYLFLGCEIMSRVPHEKGDPTYNTWSGATQRTRHGTTRTPTRTRRNGGQYLVTFQSHS
jgi:hypothetical protein